jgi:hypothetical protein
MSYDQLVRIWRLTKCPILFIPSLLFVYYLIFILLETLQSIYLPFYLIVMAGVGKIINFCQIFKRVLMLACTV